MDDVEPRIGSETAARPAEAVRVELSIIVPVFNESGNVLPLIDEIAVALQGHGREYEIVLVDDGSTDDTWSQITEGRRRHRRVRGLRHDRNYGQSAALWTGVQATQSPIIATLDGDRQNDPVDLPKLLRLLAEADFVIGIRQHRADNWLRRWSSRVARWARCAVLGVRLQDTGCSLRVFTRDSLVGVFPFNGLHRFLPILVQEGGARVIEVPVNHRPRTQGESKYGLGNRLWRGIADLLAMIWYRRRRLPRVQWQELKNP